MKFLQENMNVMSETSSSSYSSLWQQIVLTEAQNALQINLFAECNLSPANNLHEYMNFIDNYISKYSTQSLSNMSALIKDFGEQSIQIKSLKKCEHHRLKGNTLYQNQLHDRALIEYRTALQQAPNSSPEIALIYANMSAVYLQKRSYQECVNAIQFALQNNYPASKRMKLIQRLKAVIKESNCRIDFPECDLPLNELLEYIRTISFNHEHVNNPAYPQCVPKYGYQTDLPDFSAACKLCHSDDKGRHIITQEEFHHGDIVLVEDPFAWLLLKPYRPMYCYGCLTELGVPVACEGCVEALYCSEECRMKSWALFHRYECRFMFLLNCMGVAHLCFKIILIAGMDKILNASSKSIVNPICPEPGYEAVWSLVDNWTQFSHESLFEYGLTAWLVVQILVSGDFVDVNDRDGIDTVRSAALHHLLQLQCNAHAITAIADEHVEDNVSSVESICQIRIATAIYSSASLLNHSCEPSVINSFHGTKLILRAQKSIESQEEVLNCYGPHYLRHPWQQRSSNLLEQYFFNCECPHCASKDGATSCLTAYACCKCGNQLEEDGTDQDTISCTNCGQHHTLSKLEEKFKQGEDLWKASFESSDGDGVNLASLNDCYKVWRTALYRHNRTLTRTMDTLAQYSWRAGTSEDNMDSSELLIRCISLTESTLESVSAVFGSKSVEWAWEALKLGEMLHAAPDCRGNGAEEVKQLCRQSWNVFTLNWGEFIANSIFSKRKMNVILQNDELQK